MVRVRVRVRFRIISALAEVWDYGGGVRDRVYG